MCVCVTPSLSVISIFTERGDPGFCHSVLYKHEEEEEEQEVEQEDDYYYIPYTTACHGVTLLI